MILCESVFSGDQVMGLIMFVLGAFSLFRGLQVRFAEVPYFVVGYRGWSSGPLVLPFGGVFAIGLCVQAFEVYFPVWVLEVNALIAIPSCLIFLLGMFIWFPWFLLPGWYRRARRAGVPREDPYAMARFKRLNKAEQREVTWADLFGGLEGEACFMARESLVVPCSPVGGAAVGLVVGLGVGAAIPVEVEGKSLGDHVADIGESVYRSIKGFFS